MEVQINYNYGNEDLEKLPLLDLAYFVLDHQKKPQNTEVSINFVTNEYIADLNMTYRGKEGPTDVLSFECDGAEETLFLTDPSPVFSLGDVFIAPDVALQQTKEYGTSFEEEISLLLVHGLLHLCGYDHIEDEEAEMMEGLETELLQAWAESRTK